MFHSELEHPVCTFVHWAYKFKKKNRSAFFDGLISQIENHYIHFDHGFVPNAFHTNVSQATCVCPQSAVSTQNHSAVLHNVPTVIYRVSQEECARLRESVPYVKVYWYNPKHLYPKLNGYGDNGLRIVGASCGSKYCNLHSWCVARQRWWPWEWNAVLIVPAWLLVACTGVGSAT